MRAMGKYQVRILAASCRRANSPRNRRPILKSGAALAVDVLDSSAGLVADVGGGRASPALERDLRVRERRATDRREGDRRKSQPGTRAPARRWATPWQRVVAAVLIVAAGLWVVRHVVRVRRAASAPVVRVAVNNAAAQDLYLQGAVSVESADRGFADEGGGFVYAGDRAGSAVCAGVCGAGGQLPAAAAVWAHDGCGCVFAGSTRRASRRWRWMRGRRRRTGRTASFELWLWNAPAAEAEFHRAILHWLRTTRRATMP